MTRVNLFIKKHPYLLFITPGFIIYTVFMIYPIVYGMYLSVFDWGGIGPKVFVGLDNFKRLFFDSRIAPMFLNAFSNNLKYIACMLCIYLPIQLLFAYLIYLRIHGSRWFQVLIFLPNIISKTVVCFFAMMIFNPTFGMLNEILADLGLAQWRTAWLANENTAFPVLIMIIGWQTLGYGMMIFIANMKGISTDLLEAAYLDGASASQRFFKVVLPLLWPSLTNIFILDIIWGLAVFDIPFILVGSAGGVNNNLDFVNLMFYRYGFGGAATGNTQYGFASAICVIMFIFILLVNTLQLGLLKKIKVDE